jgi:hypothetical protein
MTDCVLAKTNPLMMFYGSNPHQVHCITRNSHYGQWEKYRALLYNVTASGLLKITGKLRLDTNFHIILFYEPASEPSC